jgi:hypothetical protein
MAPLAQRPYPFSFSPQAGIGGLDSVALGLAGPCCPTNSRWCGAIGKATGVIGLVEGRDVGPVQARAENAWAGAAGASFCLHRAFSSHSLAEYSSRVFPFGQRQIPG